jgi:hypothetical protein
MKYALIIIVALTAGIWGYNIGSVNTVLANDNQTISKDYKETHCDDITRETDGALVCKINMQAEDDNIKIFETVNPQQTINANDLQGTK